MVARFEHQGVVGDTSIVDVKQDRQALEDYLVKFPNNRRALSGSTWDWLLPRSSRTPADIKLQRRRDAQAIEGREDARPSSRCETIGARIHLGRAGDLRAWQRPEQELFPKTSRSTGRSLTKEIAYGMPFMEAPFLLE